jgi:transcriptional regulator with XRE-family HTH domain
MAELSVTDIVDSPRLRGATGRARREIQRGSAVRHVADRVVRGCGTTPFAPSTAGWCVWQTGGHDRTAAARAGPFPAGQARRGDPGELGLPTAAGPRRTPGLRREELAALAGVSIDYYIRLERGKETRPSPAVLDALARALRLDAEESSYLREIAAQAARGAAARPRPASAPARCVRPTLLRMLEAVRPCPAYVLSRTNDILAANPSGLHLMPGMADWPAKQRNTIRYTFLHPYAQTLWPDWETKARSCVAHLRAVVGSVPDAPDLVALVGELVVKSPDFSRMWERYDVRRVGYGQKTFLHPELGRITLSHEVLEVVRRRTSGWSSTPPSPAPRTTTRSCCWT